MVTKENIHVVLLHTQCFVGKSQAAFTRLCFQHKNEHLVTVLAFRLAYGKTQNLEFRPEFWIKNLNALHVVKLLSECVRLAS